MQPADGRLCTFGLLDHSGQLPLFYRARNQRLSGLSPQVKVLCIYRVISDLLACARETPAKTFM